MGITTYVDHDDVEHQFENEPGDEDESVRNKVGLPNAVRTQLTNIAASLASLAGVISGGRFGVDLTSGVTSTIENIATYLNTIAASVAANRVAVDLATLPTANLATIAGAISAARMAVDLATTPTANLATLAGAITSARMGVNVDSTTQGKLDALNPSTAICGQDAVGTTQAALSSQSCTQGAWVKNISTGTQLVYVYYGVATTTNGYQLAVGEDRFFACRNVNELHAIASAASARVSWLAS